MANQIIQKFEDNQDNLPDIMRREKEERDALNVNQKENVCYDQFGKMDKKEC